MANENKKKALIAPIAAAGILVMVFGINIGLQTVGISTGWLVLLGLSGYLMAEKGPSKEALLPFVCGSFLGILGGQLFVVFLPAFILFAFSLLTCKVGNWLTTFMNDYTLLYMTVYTIPLVANPGILWHDLVVHGAFCIVLVIAVCAITRKAGAADSEHVPAEQA